VAKILRAIAQKESPQLVILGKQAIDDELHQTARCSAVAAGDLRFQGEDLGRSNGKREVTRE